MTEEEKQVIKLLEKVGSTKYSSDYEIALYEFGKYSKTILSLIEKQDKTIYKMAEYIASLDIDEDICKHKVKADCDDVLDGVGQDVCARCIIEYFEKEEE